MSEAATWQFRTMDEDQKHVGPTHREHLAPGGAVQPLVRESIQNSLDVTIEGQPTKVAFTLGTATVVNARPYFEALWPHLGAITRSLPEGLPNADHDVRFLAIEDYNTTGLEGDETARSESNPDGTKNHFFRFWHCVGPAAESKRRGSWGVGKVVFSNASLIRTFFGLTLRARDSTPLLMGEAGLTIHPLNGKTYDWYGYYASHETRQDDQGKSHNVLRPIQESIDQFVQTFSLTRASAGLSIVVPYVREEVTFNSLACAVIEQYFLPILAGRLEVIVREGSQRIEISRSSIDDVVTQLKWPDSGFSTQREVTALLGLARWQLSLNNEYVRTAEVGSDGQYALGKDKFAEGVLLRLSDDFAANKRIALRIPVQVRPREGLSGTEDVRLVLERDESLRTCNVPHLRSVINISKLRSQGSLGVRGLLLVGVDLEQGLLDKLLQASEGPAHMNWELQGEGYDKAKSLYEDAHKVISFLRHLVRNLVELLSAPQDDRDTRTLSAFFPDYSDEGNASGPNLGQKRGRGPKEPAALPPPPSGVIEGVVQSFGPFPKGKRPVEEASVSLKSIATPEEPAIEIKTGVDGKFRFEKLTPGNYELHARKDGAGEAQTIVNLPTDNGVYIELLLHRPPVPKMFSKVRLDDGFAVRGNPEFDGSLRPVRVRLAYAAWGGLKSYNVADFSLEDNRMAIGFSGIQEQERSQLVVAPNILRFQPVTRDFYVEVRGFDVNRALYADARSIDEEESDGGDE
jgi:hypothetical protein